MLAARLQGASVRFMRPATAMLTARPLLRAFPAWHGRVDERLFETGGLFTTTPDGVDIAGTGTTVTSVRSRR